MLKQKIILTKQPKKRIEYIDTLKGFAIFIVLWGHSIQNLKDDYDFFHNPIFEFIYAIHMPLFFLVSGFFFHSVLKLNFINFLYKKSIQLLLPCIVWALIFFIINFSTAFINDNNLYVDNWLNELKDLLYPNKWIWFLRELFISYLIVYLFLKLFRKTWLALILSISIILFAPFMGFQRVLLPAFWVGIYLKNNYVIISKYSKQWMLISSVIFILCLFFWNGNYTMYITKFPMLSRIKTLDINLYYISVFRIFIGIWGSLFVFMFFENYYKSNRLTFYLKKVGINTLAIYLLQRLILEHYFKVLIDFHNINIWVYNFIITPLFSILTLFICFTVIYFTEQKKYLELFLFGKK